MDCPLSLSSFLIAVIRISPLPFSNGSRLVQSKVAICVFFFLSLFYELTYYQKGGEVDNHVNEKCSISFNPCRVAHILGGTPSPSPSLSGCWNLPSFTLLPQPWPFIEKMKIGVNCN